MFGNPPASDAEDILQKFLEAPYDDETTPEKIGSCDIEVEEESNDPLDEVDEHIASSKAIIHESPFNIEAICRFPQLSELLDAGKKIRKYDKFSFFPVGLSMFFTSGLLICHYGHPYLLNLKSDMRMIEHPLTFVNMSRVASQMPKWNHILIY